MDERGNPYGTPIAAVSGEQVAGALAFVANHQSKATIARFPGGAVAGDFLVTLVGDAIDDQHMIMLTRVNSATALAEPNCVGVALASPQLNDATQQKRLIFKATVAPFTPTDPTDFTIEFRRTLAAF